LLRSETAQDPARTARALRGLRAYQEAERPAPASPMPAVAEALGATLRDYGGSGPPVVFVPSLINPPNILDLSGNSLLRWLAESGHHPYLVDWGWDVSARAALSVAGHVEAVLLPLLRSLGGAPSLVGYCLGGTMAIAAAAHLPVGSVATIAAPWHFSAYPAPAQAMLAALWDQGRPTAERLGVFPMELLQSAFWSLDPGRTIAKFERFADMDPGSAEAKAFVLLEDWANDGPPIGREAARELFEGLFRADLAGTGAWQVQGAPVRPESLPCPLLAIVSTVDRIVPAESAIGLGQRIEIAKGHVGMIVGRGARETLWQPLGAWLSRTAASC
jgi:polyhydroxyalkanoate synthase